MENKGRLPSKLTDFKGKTPRVTFTHQAKDEADLIVTQELIKLYTQEDGFHCPKCGVVIKDLDDAVYHLGEEINKTLEELEQRGK